MSDIPTPETYNLAPWPNETGYHATPTLRCKWCNGVGNMKPLPRKYEEGSLESGFLAPAAICPRCKGSGLDPDCTKEEIRKGVRLSKSPATKWYVTDYPVEGSFAITDGYEIFAQIIGGKTVGDECDLANRIAKLPDLERERDKAMKDAAQIADRLSGLELRTADELAKMEQERNASRELAIAFHNDQTNLILLLQEWRDMAAKLVNIASYALGEFDVQLTLEQQRTITETMRQYHSLLKKK